MENRSVKKIAIIGAESTGKTQLCKDLALQYNTLWVPEYAREYFNDSDIYNYTLQDLERIAEKQIALEQKAAENANTLLFCDTALLTLKIWAELEFGMCPDSIQERMSKNPYDHYLITNNDVEWEADPLRLNKFSRDLIFNMNLAEVEKMEGQFAVISGRGKERLLNACRLLSKLIGT